MKQLHLDFDAAGRVRPAGRGGWPAAPPGEQPPGRLGGASVLVAELARIARETGRGRKILVARTRGEGKELLRQVALRGQSWVGFEVVTVRPLAMSFAAQPLAEAGVRAMDEFDEQALIEEAIDEALAAGRGDGSGARFAGLAEKVGFRDAVRHSVTALRLGGIRAHAVRGGDGPASAREALVVGVLERLEGLLEARGRGDTAMVLEKAAAVVEETRDGSGGPGGGPVPTVPGVPDRDSVPTAPGVPAADVPILLVPGLSDRGLAGRFVRALERHRGAVLLKTDPVEGLPVPRRVLWEVAPARGAGSFLHAVEAWVGSCGAAATVPAGESAEGRRGSASPRIELFAAGSVHDELRGVLRRAIDMGARWDQVEIVAADPALYGSALHALADSLGVPVTFAVGLPVERTRPGRVAATYFKWIESGYQESLLRTLIESGDLTLPRPHHRLRGPRLARALRRLRIGWGRDRYLARIDPRLRDLPTLPAGRHEDEEGLARRKRRTEVELRALRELVAPVLAATPDVRAPEHVARRGGAQRGDGGGVSPAQIATGVKSLLARVADGTETDDTARDRLRRRLDRIEATLTRLTDPPSAMAIVKSLLAIRIPAPRSEGTAPWSSAAGHLYLTDIQHGGAAGRPFTFVVGLDSGRFPGSMVEDPLLHDRDRLRLGQGELPFAGDRAADARFNLAQLVARVRGTLVLSYARWDPAEARALSPAPELLQALRLREGDPTLDFEELENRLGPSESRLPRPGLRTDLDAGDVWLRALATSDGRLRDGLEVVGQAHRQLEKGMKAAKALRRNVASVHAGILGTTSPPSSYQDLRGRTLSASRLESLGACPRRFLFNVVLGVRPPDDPEFDPHRWLDALQRGSLLHDVYERTLREARDRGIEPGDDAFLTLALERADREVARTRRRVPSPSPVVRNLEVDALREDVRSFVEMIRGAPPPWTALEMDFGMDDVGVPIPAGEDRAVRVRGRIDRLDDHGSHLLVVDYKTGSDYGHGAKSGLYRGGRRLQHALYTAAVAATMGREVHRMEYHFPTRRGENRIRPYAVADLRHGGALVAEMLDGAALGWFPATDDPDDCRFCDYQEVCGVKAEGRGKPSCRFSEWTRGNLATLPELSALRRTRRWEDEEPLA